MAKISVILKTKYPAKDGLYPIIVKVRAKSQVREFNVGFRVRENQWQGEVIKHDDKELINAKIADKVAEIRAYLNDCIMTGREIDLKRIGTPLKSVFFTDYLKARQDSYYDTGQPGAAGRLKYILSELTPLFGRLAFDDITADVLRKYHAFLLKSHSPNTIHKRFATLRQLFTNAVNEGVYVGANPFISFKVKTVPVRKEKLTTGEIKAMEEVKLKGAVDIARDIFLFSYYCKGIRFENVALLQRKDIRDGRIYVRTNKGNKFISIAIHDKLQGILDKYKGNFVFGLVDEIPENKRAVLDGINVVINRNLKVVAAAAGIEKNVSIHIARHSLAMHLKQKGVDMAAIKDILGHSDTATTERYLQALDDEILDSEMAKVYKQGQG